MSMSKFKCKLLNIIFIISNERDLLAEIVEELNMCIHVYVYMYVYVYK